MNLSREVGKAAGSAIVATGVLAVLILVGSRNLEHFDAALDAGFLWNLYRLER